MSLLGRYDKLHRNLEIASSIRGNKMTIEDRFRAKIQSGDTPSDVGKPDFTGSLTMFAKCQKKDPR